MHRRLRRGGRTKDLSADGNKVYSTNSATSRLEADFESLQLLCTTRGPFYGVMLAATCMSELPALA